MLVKPKCFYIRAITIVINHLTVHCEFAHGLWLQGEAAFLTQSFRDTEPQQVMTKMELVQIE